MSLLPLGQMPPGSLSAFRQVVTQRKRPFWPLLVDLFVYVVRTAENKISRPCKSGRRRSSMTCLPICCPDCQSTLRPPRSCTLRLWGGTEAETSDAVYCRTLLLGGENRQKEALPFESSRQKKWKIHSRQKQGRDPFIDLRRLCVTNLVSFLDTAIFEKMFLTYTLFWKSFPFSHPFF